MVALLFQTRTERDTALAEKTKADRRISELTEQAASADVQVLQLNEQLRLATVRIQELIVQQPFQSPSNDDVWPNEPPFSVSGHAAFTVEKGHGLPSTTIYKAVSEALFWAWDKRIGIDVWRGFLNYDEVMEHLKPAPQYGDLVSLGRMLHMHFVADTVDAVMIEVDLPELKRYLEGLEKLKARAIVFNDADQYGLEGVQLLIDLARLYTDLPIILSLRGSADVEAYRSLGKEIYIEIQTFGTVSEMKNTFLKKAKVVDIFCLGAFKAMTAAQLKALYDTVLAADAMPRSFYFYCDLPEDWPAMPQAEVDVLKSFVTRWRGTL